jgi:hypothetical protein
LQNDYGLGCRYACLFLRFRLAKFSANLHEVFYVFVLWWNVKLLNSWVVPIHPAKEGRVNVQRNGALTLSTYCKINLEATRGDHGSSKRRGSDSDRYFKYMPKGREGHPPNVQSELELLHTSQVFGYDVQAGITRQNLQ